MPYKAGVLSGYTMLSRIFRPHVLQACGCFPRRPYFPTGFSSGYPTGPVHPHKMPSTVVAHDRAPGKIIAPETPYAFGMAPHAGWRSRAPNRPRSRRTIGNPAQFFAPVATCRSGQPYIDLTVAQYLFEQRMTLPFINGRAKSQTHRILQPRQLG
jgi:hypothetical protein